MRDNCVSREKYCQKFSSTYLEGGNTTRCDYLRTTNHPKLRNIILANESGTIGSNLAHASSTIVRQTSPKHVPKPRFCNTFQNVPQTFQQRPSKCSQTIFFLNFARLGELFRLVCCGQVQFLVLYRRFLRPVAARVRLRPSALLLVGPGLL